MSTPEAPRQLGAACIAPRDRLDAQRIASVEAIVRDWLEEPELLVIAGRWGNGAVMELVPRSPPLLTAPRYEGRFAGLRDLLLDGEGHHVHLDFARLDQATYLVSPSVCFGFRPSFELRLHARGGDPVEGFGLGFSLRWPYRGGSLARAAVQRYFGRYRRHRAAYASAVAFVALGPAHGVHPAADFDWSEVGEIAIDARRPSCSSARDLAGLVNLLACEDR